MQKTLLFTSILNLCGLVALTSYILLTNQKLVYVDSAQLVNNYKGMQDARKAYQQKATTWKANIDTLAGEVQKQIMGYDKESTQMTPKERQLTQELIKTKQNQLMEYQRALNVQAQQEEGRMNGDVASQVNAYLKKYGKEHGYRIILAATEYGNLAYADERLDITQEVLEGLNKEYVGQ